MLAKSDQPKTLASLYQTTRHYISDNCHFIFRPCAEGRPQVIKTLRDACKSSLLSMQ
jgi:hypothetical protein